MNMHRKARGGALCGADVSSSLLTLDDEKVKCKKCRLALAELKYTKTHTAALKKLVTKEDSNE